MNCSVKFFDPTLMVCAAAWPVNASAARIASRMRMSCLPVCRGEPIKASGEPQLLADAQALALLDHGVGQRDVAERQPAVPEQDGLVVALAAGPEAGNDLAHLGMQCLFRELAGIDVRPEAAERAALALAPVVDHQLLAD